MHKTMDQHGVCSSSGNMKSISYCITHSQVYQVIRQDTEEPNITAFSQVESC